MAGSGLHKMMKKKCSDINIWSNDFYSTACNLIVTNIDSTIRRNNKPMSGCYKDVQINTNFQAKMQVQN